jgi:hypothetical protein
MVSCGHFPSFRPHGLLTFARRGANCCHGRDQLGPLVARGEFAVWDTPSQWSCSGYRGGHVGEGHLMEIKEETIQDWGNLVVVAGWSRN